MSDLNPDFQTAFIIAQGIVQFLNFFEGVCFRLSTKKELRITKKPAVFQRTSYCGWDSASSGSGEFWIVR